MAAIRRIAITCAALVLSTVVTAAAPQVNFPLSSQLPPVARVGQPYSFQFALTTFQPDADKLQYSLLRNPSWLSLHGENRTLWGTPSRSDAGTVTFTIAAAGEAGAVANLESHLFVADEPAPTVSANISDVLSSAGQLSGSKSVTFLPSKPFEIKFSKDAFHTKEKSPIFYATLADHTPLPAWISFDASSLHFAGTTPPLTSSPQTYKITLIMSDVPDYTAASLSFDLVVSNHQLLFKPLQQTVNITKGDPVKITNLRESLFLDSAPIKEGDIKSASADLPHWLSFDDNTLDINGTPPSGLMSQDVNISVSDQFGDTATHTIHLQFKSDLFAEEIGVLNITAGQHFEYKIPGSVLANDDEKVEVDFGPLANWLTFNAETLVISGTLPSDHVLQDAQVSMTATSSDGTHKDTQSFQFHISGPGANNSTGNEQTTSGKSNDDQARHESFKRAGVVAGATVGAVIGAFIVIALLLVLCRRKKKQDSYISPKTPRSPQKTDISRPIMIHDEWEQNENSFDRDVEKGSVDDTVLKRTPEEPPRLRLPLMTKRKDSHSPNSSISESDSKVLDSFNHSDYGLPEDEPGPSHRPHDSMRIPTAMARRESARLSSSISPVHKRRSQRTTVYRDSYHSSGLPVNRRLTGLGSGRHTYSPSRSNINSVMAGFRRPQSYLSDSTRSTSILSTVPSALPQSPAARRITQFTTPKDKRQSVRLVPSPSDILIERSLEDSRTLDEKRRSYIRKRASAQFAAPFFGADSSRVSSANYKSPPAFINNSAPPSQPAPSPLVTVTPNSKDLPTRNFERELPDSLRIRKPSETPSVDTPNWKQLSANFTGSLRKPVMARSFTNRYTTSATTDQNRIQKRYERPGTAVYPGTNIARRRSSVRQSFRAQELKSSLNSLTGSRVFDDAEISESVYSTEDEDIEEYEKRTTVKPNQYTLPPLKLSSGNNRRSSKRDSSMDSKQVSKKISERDPTPYSLALEHGGKENKSSTMSLDLLSGANGKTEATKQSPERPKTTIATITERRTRPSQHSRSDSRTTARTSAQRDSQGKLISRQLSNRTRHSRTQSHHSAGKPATRDRSRTQSSAYPIFDASSLNVAAPSTSKAGSSNKENLSALPQEATNSSLLARDPSGNILDYADLEDPTIEELDTSSIGFRTSNGKIKPSARQSRLARLASPEPSQSRPSSHRRRETAIGPIRSTESNQNSIGLGLTLHNDKQEDVEDKSRKEAQRGRGRERTPLSVLDDGNGTGAGTGPGNVTASPEHLTIRDDKAKRPVSVEVVDEELRVGKSRKGRRTWGRSLKKIVPSGGSNVWSGAGDRDTKAFI